MQLLPSIPGVVRAYQFDKVFTFLIRKEAFDKVRAWRPGELSKFTSPFLLQDQNNQQLRQKRISQREAAKGFSLICGISTFDTQFEIGSSPQTRSPVIGNRRSPALRTRQKFETLVKRN